MTGNSTPLLVAQTNAKSRERANVRLLEPANEENGVPANEVRSFGTCITTQARKLFPTHENRVICKEAETSLSRE